MRDSVYIYLARDIPAFVMYCVNGESGSSLLIESIPTLYLYPWEVHLVPRGPPVNAQRANVRPAE